MNGIRLLATCLLALCSVGCADNMDEELAQFSAARQQWLVASHGRDYAFEYRCKGYCAEIARQVFIEVRDGRVASVESRTDEGASTTVATVGAFPSMDILFGQVFEALEMQSERLTKVSVKYDPSLGFPAYLRYDLPDTPEGKREIFISAIRWGSS